jgi:preprotein translocase subunit YajC
LCGDYLIFRRIIVSGLFTSAFAQDKGAPQPGGGNFLVNLLPIVAMIAIFYFLLIRPTQKKEKERKKLIESIQKGDKVITAGGMYGVVTGVDPEKGIVTLKIGENTKVDFAKSAIQGKVS